MAENRGKWPPKRGPISKIRPSDGCGMDAVPLVVERWCDFPEFGCHLGNVGLGRALRTGRGLPLGGATTEVMRTAGVVDFGSPSPVPDPAEVVAEHHPAAIAARRRTIRPLRGLRRGECRDRAVNVAAGRGIGDHTLTAHVFGI